MAHYHLTISANSSMSGGAHSDYILRQGKYSDRDDLVHSKSGNMPQWAEHEPSQFWVCADLYERQNGRKYTEIEFALARELSEEQRIEVAEKYIDNIVGDKHAYTYAIHNKIDENGNEYPHVHFMFSERENDGIDRTPKEFFSRANTKNPEDGGAKKDRMFSSQAFVWEARKEWTRTANHYFEEKGLGIRIDDRSYEARGIDLQSTNIKYPYTKDRDSLMKFQHESNERLKDIQRQNGEKIINDPTNALKALTSNDSTFTKNDLEAYIFRHTDGEDQYKEAYNAVIEHDQFKSLLGKEQFTTKELYDIENNIVDRVHDSNHKNIEPVSKSQKDISQAIINSRTFNPEQEIAFNKLVSNSEIVSVNGSAGTGKSYVLSAVNESYKEQGKDVYGVALQGITAQSMQDDAGIKSSTIASFIMRVESGKQSIDSNSVIVLDEAGMVGSRDMQKLLQITQDNGAKIRMVGDSQQLSAVSAGNAYKAIQESLNDENQSTLDSIMRQRNETMNDASKDLAKHDVSSALDKYDELGKVNEFESAEMAQAQTVKGWYESNADSKLMLAYTNKDVNALNAQARELLKEDGTLNQNDYLAKTNKGELLLSVNEKIIFKENNKELGVMNGTQGHITSITTDENGQAYLLGVQTDTGKLSVNLENYNSIKHGYATTIHGSQGMTVDETHLLVSDHMNANLSYVGMTRHRDDLQINYSKESYKDFDNLKEQLSKSDVKEFSADYQLDESFDEIRNDLTIEKRQTFKEKYNQENAENADNADKVASNDIKPGHEENQDKYQEQNEAQRDPKEIEQEEPSLEPEAPESEEVEQEASEAPATEEIEQEEPSLEPEAPESEEVEQKPRELTNQEKFQQMMAESQQQESGQEEPKQELSNQEKFQQMMAESQQKEEPKQELTNQERFKQMMAEDQSQTQGEEITENEKELDTVEAPTLTSASENDLEDLEMFGQNKEVDTETADRLAREAHLQQMQQDVIDRQQEAEQAEQDAKDANSNNDQQHEDSSPKSISLSQELEAEESEQEAPEAEESEQEAPEAEESEAEESEQEAPEAEESEQEAPEAEESEQEASEAEESEQEVPEAEESEQEAPEAEESEQEAPESEESEQEARELTNQEKFQQMMAESQQQESGQEEPEQELSNQEKFEQMMAESENQSESEQEAPEMETADQDMEM